MTGATPIDEALTCPGVYYLLDGTSENLNKDTDYSLSPKNQTETNFTLDAINAVRDGNGVDGFPEGYECPIGIIFYNLSRQETDSYLATIKIGEDNTVTGGDYESEPAGNKTITDVDLDGAFSAFANGSELALTSLTNVQATVDSVTDSRAVNANQTVEWTKNGGPTSGTVTAGEYKAKITIAPNDGYEFGTLTPENIKNVGGSGIVTSVTKSGNSLVIEITFTVVESDQVITHIKGNLTAPAVKTTPDTNAAEVQVAPDESSYVNANNTTPEITWSENATRLEGKPAAGAGEYTAKFTVTAPNGYKFDEGQTPTVVTPAGAKEATAEVKNESEAEVTVTYNEIKKTADDISVDSIKYTEVTVGGTYSNAFPEVTITYNDGSTVKASNNVDYARYDLQVDATAIPEVSVKGNVEGTQLNTANRYDVYVEYIGDKTDPGASLRKRIEEVNVTYEALGDVNVSVKLPTVGELAAQINHGDRELTAVLAASGDGINDEETTIEWFNDQNCESGLGDATFPYGGEYYAKISISAQEPGYKFNPGAPPTVTFENTDSLHSSEDKSTITAEPISVTVDPDNPAALTAVFKVNMPKAPNIVSAEPSPYDYYNDSQDLKITLSRDLINGLNGTNIQIGTDNVPASLTDQKTITVTAAEVRKFLQQKWGTSADNPLTASHVQEEWDIHIPIERSGNTIDGTAAFKAVNTTPYLTIEKPEHGSIEVKETAGSGETYTSAGTYPLKKGTSYTITAKDDGDYKFKSWNAGTPGAGDEATRTFTPAASGTYTVGATFEGPIEMTVSADNGTVTSVKEDGDGGETISEDGGTYKIYPGKKYVVTVTPGDDYKFSDPAWTVADATLSDGLDGGQTSGARTYTFTAPATSFTLTANLVLDTKTLTIKKTGDGTITVKKTDGSEISGSPGSDGITTYEIKKSDCPVTVTATADNAYKLTKFGSDVLPAVQTKDTIYDAYENVPADTVDVTFTAKVVPDWDDAQTSDRGARHQKNITVGGLKYTHNNSADYTFKEYKITGPNGDTQKASGSALTSNTLTLDDTTLDLYDEGTYTVTFTFTDNLDSGNSTLEKTIDRQFEITGAPKVSSVTLPSGKVHGDNLGTFEFALDNGSTYKYTAGSGWDHEPPESIKVSVGGASVISLSEFITKYVQTGTIVRYQAKSGGGDAHATLCNGDSIAVSIPGTTPATATLEVGQKTVTLEVTNTNLDKTYDGDNQVKAELTWNASDTPINDDKSALGDTFTDTDKTSNGLTVNGTYQGGANADESNNKTIKFNVTKDPSKTELENYDITVEDGQGKINKKEITVSAEAFKEDIPEAPYGEASTGQRTIHGLKDDQLETIDASSGIDVQYTYTYKNGTDTNVEISNATSTNYTIIISPNETTGSRAKRTVQSIEVTPKYTATGAFYSSDTFDATITINYTDGGAADTYPSIEAALATDSKIQSVTWNGVAGVSDAQNTKLTVAGYNGKTVTATVKTDAVEAGDVTSGTSAAITVKRIPVVVTVMATDGISKTYDGTKTFTPGTHTGTLSYTAEVDESALGAAGVAVTDDYNMGDVTATGATVEFAQADVYDKTYNGGGVQYSDIATAEEGTLSDDTEYEVKQTVSHIEEAQITALTITVKQIDYIKSVRVGAAGVRKGQAKVAAVPGSAPPESEGYTAFVTLNNDHGEQDIAKKDNLLFDIKYEYDDTKTTHENNSAEVTLHSVTLADSNTKKDNYTFKPLESKEDANSVDGHGTVTAANIESVKLTLPSSLNPSDGNGHMVYGEGEYKDFQGDDYIGLTVVINYNGSDDTATYVLKKKDGGSEYEWQVTETGVEGTMSADFGNQPFTLKWSGADLAGGDPQDVALGTPFTWTCEKNGRQLTAAIDEQHDTKTINVNPKLLTVTPKYSNGSDGTTPTKNYDGGYSILPAGSWTYEVSNAIAEDGIAVELAEGKNPAYLSKDASTGDISIKFGESYDGNIHDDDWKITGTNNTSYKIGTLNDAKGKINPRPLTLVSITDIPSVDQFSALHKYENAVASNVSGGGSQAKANFAGRVDTPEGQGTGLVGDDQVSITYDYTYTDTSEAGDVEAADKLTIENVKLQSGINNYSLNDVDEGTLTRKGSVKAAEVTDVTIEEPTMYEASKTAYAVQVGDKYDYAGLEITLHYSGGMDVTYKPETYKEAPDKGVATWTVTYSDRPGHTETGVSTVPFELTCDHGGHAQGEALNEVTEGHPESGKLQVKINGEEKATTTDTLDVFPRRVTVTPTGDISKTYDGTTDYAVENGAITYELTADETAYNDSYSLPEGISATADASDIKFDSAIASGNVGGATKVTINNIKLTSTDPSWETDKGKYQFISGDAGADTTTATITPATINKRSVTITEVHKLPSVVQGSTPTEQTAENVTTNETKSPYAKVSGETPVANPGGVNEELELTVSYQYENTKTVTDEDKANVTISEVKAKTGSNTERNYTVTADPSVTGHGTVTAANYSVEVTNPSQFTGGGYEFNEDGLNVDGLTVKLTNTNPAASSDTTTYYAVKDADGNIEWRTDKDNPESKVEVPPFTLKWSGDHVGAGTDVKPGMKLPPAQYNGAQLTATLTTLNTDPSKPSSASGDKVTVNKKKIDTVTASGDDIEKVYDGNTDVTKLITYAIPTDQTIDGTPATLTPDVTAKYADKNVADNIAIKFTLNNKTANTDPNYEFASEVTIADLTGKITKRTVNVTDVYVPGITANSSDPQPTVTVTDAKAVTTSSGVLTSKQVRANNFVTGEESYFTFSYTITYRDGDARGTSGATNPVFVTMSGNTCEATPEAAANNVSINNYEIQWTDVETKSRKSTDASSSIDWNALHTAQPGESQSSYLLGNVVADTYKEVSPPTDAGNKITSEVNPHKHGDKLDLTGLTINVTSTTYGELEYKIAGEAGAQYWTSDGSSEVTLPDGIAVHIGNIPITTKADLENLQAHYTNMNGKDIILEVTGQPAKTSANKVVVKQAELHVTADNTEYDKYYDGNDNVVSSFTLTPTDTELVTFTKNSYKDQVTVTGTAKYASADVAGTAAAPTQQNITFTLTPGGDDKDNYILVAPTDVKGKINPRTVVVSEFGDNVKADDATYNDTSSATGEVDNIPGTTGSVNGQYTYTAKSEEGAWPIGLAAPTIKVTYDYGSLVSNSIGEVTIEKSGTVNSDHFDVELSHATNNFVLDTTAVTELKGNVKAAAITSLNVTKGKTDYYYGDKLTDADLADLEITVNGTDTFSYFAGGEVNPKFAHYGLTLEVKNGDGTTVSDRDTDVLKNGTAQAKITVSGGGQSQDVELTVSKRKLVVKASGEVTKEYDGKTDANLTDKLTIAPKEEQGDASDGYGLADADEALATTAGGYTTAFSVTATEAMYTKGSAPVKDAWVSGDSYNITANVTLGTTTDIPTDQYELELKDVKGKITPKPVTLTPVLQYTYYIKNEAETITSEQKYTADAFVSGEEAYYNFTYTVKLSADTHNTAGAKSITAAAALGTGDDAYKSTTVDSSTADGYEWEITATNAETYPLTNYTFTRANASITISNREFDHASIVETDRHMQRTYRSGDGVNFKDLEVRVYYKNDTTFYTSYVFGTESWNNSFEIVNTDGDTVVSNGTVLTTADDGTTYKVKIGTRSGGEAVYTDNATSPITVTANELKVTAVQSGTPSRPYNGTADASMFVKYEFTEDAKALIAGKTVTIDSDTAAEVFTDSNPSYVGVDKPIGITATDSSFTLGGADAAQYTVKWVPPTGLKGTIEKLNVTIQSLPLVRAGMDSAATSGVEVEAPSASIGDDAKTYVVLDPGSTMPEADKQQFSATWTAVFTQEQIQSGSTDADAPMNLTFKKDGDADVYPVVKDKSGNTELFTENYNFTWPAPRGIVVPSAIRISHSDYTPVTSVHGNAFNLDGIKFTVEYKNDIDMAKIFTFRHKDGKWQVAAGEDVMTDSSFKDITDDDFANKYGIQLQWNATSSTAELVPSGAVTGYANRGLYNGKPIVIMVASHNGDGKYEMAATNTVTINPRYIYAFVRKYTDGTSSTPVQLDKEYDGTPYADPSGLEFEFYDFTTNSNAGNDAEDNSGFNKYTSPFVGETLAIKKPAKGVQSVGDQLKAEYLGGENASYKKAGDSWVQCNIDGKDVKRDENGLVVTKKIQLSNLHLVNTYDGNYVLANADSWHLDAVTGGFDRYHPTDTKGEVNTDNQVDGKITTKKMTVTVNSVPSIAKDTGDTTVDLTPSNYTITGSVAGDVFSQLKLTATYSDASKVGPQTTTIDHSGEQADYPELDYDITFTPTSVTGNVNDKGVTKLEITGPTKKAYVHGDTLDLKGTEITVTYSDNTSYKYTYNGTNTVSPWQLQKYAAGGAEDGDPELVPSPLDVTLRWQNGTDYVDSNEVMMYNAADKGYTGTDPKTAHIQVSSSLATEAGGTTYADPAVSEGITVARRPLGLSVTGTVTKVYDGTNRLPTDTTGLTIKVVNPDKTDLPTTLSVSYDMESAKENMLEMRSTGGEPNSYVNDTASPKSIYIGSSADNIRRYIKVGAGDDLSSYTGPATSSGGAITNTAAGNITKRPITIKANTLPTLDLNTATLDSTDPNKYTVDLDVDQGHFTIEGPSDGIGIMTYDDHKEAKAEWSITYDLTGKDRNSVESAPITFSDGTLAANGAENDTLVVGNYEPTWDENHITTASVTPLAAAKGITATPPSKSEYKHGETLDLTDMTVTVTKGDETTETYTYTAEGWKKEGTVVPDADLPFELYWSAGTDEAEDPANKAAQDDVLSLTDPKNDADDAADGSGKDFHISVKAKSNNAVHDEVDITVKPKTVTVTVSGTVEQEYQGKNHTAVDNVASLAFAVPEVATFKVGTDDIVIGEASVKAASFADGNAGSGKPITVTAAYELTGADKDNYNIVYTNSATGTITKKAITVTANSVPSIGRNAANPTVTISDSDYKITANNAPFTFYTEDNVQVVFTGTYPTPLTPGEQTVTLNGSLTGTESENYAPEFKPTTMQGMVNDRTVESIEINSQPTYTEDQSVPEGTQVDPLEGLEITVKYNDGTVEHHKRENGQWKTDGDYTVPEDVTFTWNKDENGGETIDPTDTVTVEKNKNNDVTIEKDGVEEKTNGVTATDSTRTYTITKKATPAEGGSVNAPADAEAGTQVAVSGSLNQGYEVESVTVTKTADGSQIEVQDGKFTMPSEDVTVEVKFKLKDYRIDKNASNATVTVDGNKTTAKMGDTVSFSVSANSGYTLGTVTVTTKVNGVDTAVPTQYENGKYTFTMPAGDVTINAPASKSSTTSSGGGGGGGGNSLIIYYELEDGKKGEIVPSKIEVPLGTDPTDLMAEIKYKLNDMTVTWSSDNEKVATVDENGVVTYVGEGQATITAVSNQNKQLKDTVKVTVTKGTAAATPTPAPSPTPTPDYENNKTDSLITGEMLNPYIVGYDDYVFGPELPISREELSAIFARLIANSIYMDKEYDTSFPDVPETWSKTYIGYLEGFNVVTGYEDGTFRPHNYITRAEMAVMMAKAEGYDISGTMDASELDFPDVDQGYSTWAVKAIKILTDKGIMQGYTDGTFRPGQPITRAETVATVNRVLADMEVADIEILPSDVTDAHWAYNDIVFAMNHRVLKDAAADPNKFIWSEQFDENMVKTNGKTAGTANDTPSEDNTSDGGADAPSDSGQAGTTE